MSPKNTTPEQQSDKNKQGLHIVVGERLKDKSPSAASVLLKA
jgi:hypothetical protein